MGKKSLHSDYNGNGRFTHELERRFMNTNQEVADEAKDLLTK
jgi:hypothetical protein